MVTGQIPPANALRTAYFGNTNTYVNRSFSGQTPPVPRFRRISGHTRRIRCFTPRPHRAREHLVSAAGQTQCLPGLYPHQCCRQRQAMDECPRVDPPHLPCPDGWLPACRLPLRAAALWIPGHKLRMDHSEGDPGWESDLLILKKTLRGAV